MSSSSWLRLLENPARFIRRPAEAAEYSRHSGRFDEFSAGVCPAMTSSRSRADFRLSNAPRFDDIFWDAIGLYLNQADQASVITLSE